ncbi:ABC-type xenobiotic transporter [Malassezia nana]|uniref:ABC-type xenobiotic transporter n=1 Tax=Malassezia nana TaxID=180528 RepID=A0AAF0J4Y5_9BASI|nr:ABC-type xenobiotic transporter [Malassezia nana]
MASRLKLTPLRLSQWSEPDASTTDSVPSTAKWSITSATHTLDSKTLASWTPEASQELWDEEKGQADLPNADTDGVYTPPIRRSWTALYRPLARKDLLLFALPGSLLALLCGGIPIGMAYVVGRAFQALAHYQPGPSSAADLLSAVERDVVALLGLAVAALLLRGLDTYLWLMLGERGAQAWRKATLRSLHAKPVAWYDLGMGLGQRDTGAAGAMSLFAEETDTVRLALGIHAGGLLRHAATVVAATAFALSRHWKLTLVIYAMLPLIFVVTAVITRLVVPWDTQVHEESVQLTAYAERSVAAIRTVKLYTWEEEHAAWFRGCAARCRRAFERWSALVGLRLGVGSALGLLTFVQGFGYGSVLVRHGHADASIVLSTFLACLVSMGQVQTILMRATALDSGITAAVRLLGVQQSRVNAGCRSRPALHVVPKPEVLGDVAIEHVWMAYPARPNTYALRGASLLFPACETTYVVGASGCGKSTLAALVSQLYTPQYGRVSLDGQDVRALPLSWYRRQVMTVRQEPFLLSGSVRANLLPYNTAVPDEQLWNVLRAVKMEDAVRAWPRGLDTAIGAHGQAMSGGQQQRLALARALLADPCVLVLDEATSALDASAASAVFSAIETWRARRTTVIITHDVARIPSDAHVYVMAEGSVAQHGTLGTIATKAQRHSVASIWSRESAGEDAGPKRQDTPLPDTPPPLAPPSAPALSYRHLLGWLWRTMPHRVWLVLGAVVSVASGLTVPAFSLCLSQVILAVAQPGLASLGRMVAATASVAVADGLLKGVRHGGMQSLAARWIERLRTTHMHMLLRQDCAYFHEPLHAPSTLASMLTKDMQDLQALVSDLVGQGVMILALTLGTWIWAVATGWQLALCVLALVPPCALVMGLHGTWLARREHRAVQARAQASERVFEYVQHVRAARAVAVDAGLCCDAASACDTAYDAGCRTSVVIALGAGIGEALMYSAEAVLYAVGAVLLIRGTYDLARVLRVLSPLVFSLSYAASTAMALPAAAQCRAAAARVQALAPHHAPSDASGKLQPQESGAWELQHVSFAYRPGVAPLQDVSVRIEAGEKVGLVGASGSGKSTLLALLARLYEPSHGVLFLDGHVLHEMDARHVRRRWAMVEQHPVLFPTSIAANIAAGEPLARPALEAAARRAHASSLIEALPARYGTTLGTTCELSGGQAQRLALARALARPALQGLLLDEPTAALDAQTRDAVLASLFDEAMQSVTMVIVTHDPAVMQRCDRLLVLDGGRIVESGTWDALCAAPGGALATLVTDL